MVRGGRWGGSLRFYHNKSMRQDSRLRMDFCFKVLYNLKIAFLKFFMSRHYFSEKNYSIIVGGSYGEFIRQSTNRVSNTLLRDG